MFGQNAFADVSFADITSPKIDYSLVCSSGTYTLVGNDALLTYTNNGAINAVKGGIDEKKRKSKVYKDSRKEVEDDITKAIAKITGKDEEIALAPESEDNSLEAEIKTAKEAKEAKESIDSKLQDLVLNAQALELQAQIDQLIQDELDDEESLMLLL